MKIIQLTNGASVQVDDDDYEELSIFKWHACKQGPRCYATRQVSFKGKKSSVRMHRQIMGVSDPKKDVDHINMDGLCNLRSNLRVCTRSQNMMNRSAMRNCKSGLKGVSWCRYTSRWRAAIRFGGKQQHIGRFDCKIAAAKAYDEKAKELFGEYARTNF